MSLMSFPGVGGPRAVMAGAALALTAAGVDLAPALGPAPSELETVRRDNRAVVTGRDLSFSSSVTDTVRNSFAR